MDTSRFMQRALRVNYIIGSVINSHICSCAKKSSALGIAKKREGEMSIDRRLSASAKVERQDDWTIQRVCWSLISVQHLSRHRLFPCDLRGDQWSPKSPHKVGKAGYQCCRLIKWECPNVARPKCLSGATHRPNSPNGGFSVCPVLFCSVSLLFSANGNLVVSEWIDL